MTVRRFLFRVLAGICLAIAIYQIARGLSNFWYFVGLLVAAALLIIVERRTNNDTKDTILVAIVSVLVSIYAAELYLTFESSFQSGTASFPPSYDQRSKRQVVFDLRAAGDSKAAPAIYPSSLVWQPDLFTGKNLTVDSLSVLPLSGLTSRTTVLCNEGGFWATYTADEAGFNNPTGLWNSPIDIAVIGDSFSHGNCVHPGEDWPSLVRKKYPRTLNLGMGGNGALYELATIKEYLLDIKPRIVIWQFLEANETRIPAEMTQPIIMKYLNEPDFRQGLRAKQEGLNRILEGVVDRALEVQTAPPLQFRFQLLQFVRLVRLRQRFISNVKPDDPHLKTLASALAEGRRVVEGWGGKLYFVYLPTALGLT
ncbi:MAG: hypothetical protein NTZ72_14595, partial [Afipia sp.]|nr:hypothetical protein [Afipia sp.]